MKNKITIALLSIITFVNVSIAGIPVTCLNCSNLFTQALEYIKDIEQLAEEIKQYDQLVKQTENAITNTMNLPSNLLSNLQSQIKVAVSNVSRLNSYKADMDALYTIFTDTWPELEEITVDQGIIEKIITKYHDVGTTWGGNIKSHAFWLLKVMLVIQLTWMALKLGLKQSTLQDVIEDLVKAVLFGSVFFCLIVYGQEWANKLIKGMAGLSVDVAGSGGTAVEVFTNSLKIADNKTTKSHSIHG